MWPERCKKENGALQNSAEEKSEAVNLFLG
jgi:hypothetical protein